MTTMLEKESVNVLYVDEEIHNLVAFKASLRKDFNIFTAISDIEAVDILSKNEIHVLVTDQPKPYALCSELLEKVSNQNPYQVRIQVTGYIDMEPMMEEAIDAGKIYKYICKPWEEDELKKTIIESYNICKVKKSILLP